MRDYKSAGRLGGLAAAKTAAERKAQRINIYNSNPKLCRFCNENIMYDKRMNDFCNHSCAAAFNNKGVRRHGEAAISCLNCETKTANEKYCSLECKVLFCWNETKSELLLNGIDTSAGNLIGKKYLKELHNGSCQICNESKWMGKPMPLVLDHISGNPYDNSLTNLRVICHNCNAQTSTFTGKNKGHGRVERARRYVIEKKIFKEMADLV